MRCFFCLCERVEALLADSGIKTRTLFLSLHNPDYGLSAFRILVRLGERERQSI